MTRLRRVRRFFAGFFITPLAVTVAGTLYQAIADWRDLATPATSSRATTRTRSSRTHP